MEKIFLIIKREYLSRVKKKSFLVGTFLVPLIFIGMWGGVIAISIQDSSSNAVIKVIDDSGLILNELSNTNSITFEKAVGDENSERKAILDEEDQYLLLIPSDITESERLQLLSSNKASIFIQSEIESQVESVLNTIKLKEAGIDQKTLESINPNVRITALEVTEAGEKESHAGVAMGIGMAAAMLIYLSLFIYGAQVMRGVIEEKNNRIVEVIISSVRPFQLMMGKIVGIGLVGLTQFFLWIILSGALMTAGSMILASQMPDMSVEQMPSVAGAANTTQVSSLTQDGVIGDIQNILAGINFPYIIGFFLVFFLGGYLLYSALFAAVGSAVDNETETQQFMLPITMPLLFTYVMAFSLLVRDPHGPLSFWLSMIPLTSPIAMMVRIPFGVPLWEILLSIALLIGGFILTTWVAARIYRVGILMYGKKASYKELIKWFRYKR